MDAEVFISREGESLKSSMEYISKQIYLLHANRQSIEELLPLIDSWLALRNSTYSCDFFSGKDAWFSPWLIYPDYESAELRINAYYFNTSDLESISQWLWRHLGLSGEVTFKDADVIYRANYNGLRLHITFNGSRECQMRMVTKTVPEWYCADD